jgi:DNA-binding transcriptional regulator YhcF (GntR family)
MEFHLDRTIPIPLVEQIRGQITYAISSGLLAAGQPLPSVRKLAATLTVAPATIAQVYRELAAQSLIFSKPGAGTFVADIAQVDGKTAHQVTHGSLQQLTDGYVRQAVALGNSAEKIRAALLQSLDRHCPDGSVPSGCHVLMVGNFGPATRSYAREIESMWHDLNVTVTPILLEQLEADLDRYDDLIKSVRLAITVPPRLQRVRTLLEPRECPVAAVAFRASPETLRRLAAISPAQRVGILSTYPDFLQTMVENVVAYGLAEAPPMCAVLGQDDRIAEMLSQVDVLVYASGSEAIGERLPDQVGAIEYRHSPEPDSVNRLRPLLS